MNSKVLNYKQLVSSEKDALFLVLTWDEENRTFEYLLNALVIKDGMVFCWGNFIGDDPDMLHPLGGEQSAECVKQEDFVDSFFLEIPKSNTLFRALDEFIADKIMKSENG